MRRTCAALALGALLALGACTPAHDAAVGGRHPWTRPGVLRIADVADPDSLNPLLSTMDLSYDLSSLLFSYLVIADAHGRPIGDLATAVPSLANGGISPDGKTYTYHLRPNVRWHDGAALTSRDVAFSWRAIVNPRNNVLHREGYQEVARIETPDPRTVVMHLKRRYPPFVTQFFTTLQEGAKPVVPAHLLDGLPEINDAPFNAQPVGSGPFRFVAWERGHRIVLAANDRYFKGRPKLRRIELIIMPDMNTVATALRTHEIDMPVAANALIYDELRALPGVRATLTDWNSELLLMLDDARPALRDPNVRRALARAIDYSVLIDKLTYRTALPARDIVPPTSLGFANNAPYPHDPVAARALLERSGWRTGRDGIRTKNGARLSLVMVIGPTGLAPLVAVQVQAMLREVGIELTIKPYPYKGIFAFDGPIVNGRFDLAVFANTLPYDPDSTSTLACGELAPKGENESRFCDRRVDALERAGLATDDPRRRAAIYREIGRRVHDLVPYLPLYRQRRPSVFNDDLHGYDPAPVAAPWWNAYTWSI
ncbi:MAG: peptide ABC transporter substrate-binding protein [Candidatus Eremiobacteraeota bacterium]|nr:peptide ABC transporter substrate-binding protein [Candidatus Eremiobacteraeota bacterium]